MIREQFGTTASGSDAAAAAVDYDSTIRFVSPDVAVEHGTTKSNSGPTPSVPVSFTAVWVKQGGKWLLDTLRESHAINASANPLKAMQWMVGEWVGTGKDFTTSWTASWSHNEKFLVRQFSIGRTGEQVNGTQYIGWDPESRRVRSWTFDSDGAIVEGTWRNEDDAWIVKTISIQPDGRRSTAINFWVPEGEDRCVLKSSHVKLDDTAVEDFVLEFARVRP